MPIPFPRRVYLTKMSRPWWSFIANCSAITPVLSWHCPAMMSIPKYILRGSDGISRNIILRGATRNLHLQIVDSDEADPSRSLSSSEAKGSG